MSLELNSSVHVAIIGAGITGLATAYYLQTRAAEHGLPLTYTLLEKSTSPGGKVVTEFVAPPDDGGQDNGSDQPFVVEAGPDSFLTQKPWALDLSLELGLANRLVGTNDQKRKVFVLNRGRPTPLPDGVLLIVPTRFMPFVTSPLISPWGKARMGMDLLIPARDDDEDETLADFIRRRLGTEALDKIAEPLMSGIYNAEAERQSLLATFPRFRDIEKKHGSLIRGMLAARRRASSSAPTAHSTARPAAKNAADAPKTMFVSLRNGTHELIEAIHDRLSGHVRFNSSVRSIALDSSLGEHYTIHLDGDEKLDADAVVVSTPAYSAADILRNVAPEAAALIADIRYVSTGTLSMAFRRQDVPHLLEGFGLVIPRSENRPMNAITISSTKFDYRAPDGYVLLRIFFGGSRNPGMVAKSDEDLLAAAGQELAALMGITAKPLFHRIYRWRNATAQYDVGHLDRVDRIEAALPAGIFVAGSPYRGIGLPDCVHQAQLAASAVIAHLAERTPAVADHT